MTPRTPYPSDLTHAEWEIAAPFISAAKSGGRPRTTDMREVLNAIFYIVRTGCQWNALPHDFLKKSTVFEYFSQWKRDNTPRKINGALRRQVRQKAGRDPEPSRIIIDSQSVKTTEAGGGKQGV